MKRWFAYMDRRGLMVFRRNRNEKSTKVGKQTYHFYGEVQPGGKVVKIR